MKDRKKRAHYRKHHELTNNKMTKPPKRRLKGMDMVSDELKGKILQLIMELEPELKLAFFDSMSSFLPDLMEGKEAASEEAIIEFVTGFLQKIDSAIKDLKKVKH